MDLLNRLKVRLPEITDDTQDALLEELILSATEIFLSLKYPVSPYPIDDDGMPIIDPRWNGWIISAAIELYGRIGIEGQTGHGENGITRSYDAGDLSLGLCQKITPQVDIVRA